MRNKIKISALTKEDLGFLAPRIPKKEVIIQQFEEPSFLRKDFWEETDIWIIDCEFLKYKEIRENSFSSPIYVLSQPGWDEEIGKFMENNLCLLVPKTSLSLLPKIILSTSQLMEKSREKVTSGGFLFQFMDALPVGIFVVEKKAGKPVYVNRRGQEILGRDFEEIRKTAMVGNMSEVFKVFLKGTDLPYPQAKAPIFKALQGEESRIEDAELEVKGKRINLEVSAAPIKDSQGRVLYAISAFQDISARLEAENQLKLYSQRLESLSRQLFQLQEEERKRLSRELHDEIGQAITALKINLESAQNISSPTRLFKILKDSVSIAEKALEQVRSLSLNLRPSLLDDLGLEPALRWLLQNLAGRAGILYSMEVDLPRRLPPEMEVACFRISQEALSNALRHSGGTEIKISLKLENQWIFLEVSDNGKGLDLKKVKEGVVRGETLGLLSMEERARNLKGSLEIVSHPGRGTTVRVKIPILSHESPSG